MLVGPPTGSRERARRISAAVAAAAVGAMLWGCTRVSRTPSATLPTLPSVQIASLTDLFPLAEVAALSWRPDAYLESIQMDIKPTISIAYIFGSSSDPSVGALVYVENPLGEPATRMEEVHSPGREQGAFPIASTDWGPIDSSEALAIALESGGLEFLERHPEAHWWFIQLQYYESPLSTETPLLRVFLSTAQGAQFNAYVDPLTGDLLDVKADG